MRNLTPINQQRNMNKKLKEQNKTIQEIKPWDWDKYAMPYDERRVKDNPKYYLDFGKSEFVKMGWYGDDKILVFWRCSICKSKHCTSLRFNMEYDLPCGKCAARYLTCLQTSLEELRTMNQELAVRSAEVEPKKRENTLFEYMR